LAGHDDRVTNAPTESLPRARRVPRRIALVTESYPPEVNGVAMSVARIAQGLHALGHDIQLVRPRQHPQDAPGPQPRFAQVTTGGWPIPNYPGLRMGAPIVGRLQRMWWHERPDVVHVATEGPLGWAALVAARRLQLPVTSDFRTNFHTYTQHYRLGWLKSAIAALLRGFHNRTHCTMVPTEALRAELSTLGFERLAVVGRGVDAALFDPARRSLALRTAWGAGEDDLVVACVGRLAAEKNLGLALLAFETIHADRPRARLLFVGDGPMRAQLQARCPQALFAGVRRGEDLAAHYASADLLLFPSVTETYGNVTAEAMASGLPVVAFDCAAAHQLIESGVDGRLAATGDDEAFVQSACALAADAAARAAMGLAARAKALRHDWPGVVARFEGVLARAIDPPPATTMEPDWMPLAPTP
jgi:glycosyltransferase involved in cell wall biosynthesis